MDLLLSKSSTCRTEPVKVLNLKTAVARFQKRDNLKTQQILIFDDNQNYIAE